MNEPLAIVRPDSKGAVDDVVITGDTFRLERMSKRHWWAAVYRGDKRVTFAITATRTGLIDVTVIEDDLGCVDDADYEAEIAAIRNGTA